MLTKKELAEALKVSRVALNQWERDGAPVGEVLEWSIEDAAAYLKEWRGQHKRPRYQDDVQPDEDGDLAQQLLAAQVREKNAAAAAKEISNEVRLGELIEKEDTAQQIVLSMSILSARLEAIPDELRKELPAELRESTAQFVEHKIFLALKEAAANMRRASNGTA